MLSRWWLVLPQAIIFAILAFKTSRDAGPYTPEYLEYLNWATAERASGNVPTEFNGAERTPLPLLSVIWTYIAIAVVVVSLLMLALGSVLISRKGADPEPG